MSEPSTDRRGLMKKAAKTATGGLLLGATGTASAACYERTLTISGNGELVDYYFKNVPVYDYCAPKKVSSTTEGSEFIKTARPGWGINGRIKDGVDKFKFTGAIDNMAFTQLSDGNDGVTFRADVSPRRDTRSSWYNIDVYAAGTGGNVESDIFLSTHIDMRKEQDFGADLEPNDGINRNNTLESHVVEGHDYFEGKGEFISGGIYPNADGETVKISPSGDF